MGGLAVETWTAGRTTPGAVHKFGESPTVVIVPGAMDRAAGFRRTIRHLGGLDVVAIDRRGYAGSIGVAPSDVLDVHVQDLSNVCEEIAGPVIVVGHSQGGLIALAAAARRHPSNLGGLVVWEPPMPWFDWYGGSGAALELGEDPSAAAEYFMRTVIGDRLWSRLPEATRAARRAEGPALLADLRASRRSNVAPDLGLIEAATIVGFGTESAAHHRRAAAVAAAAILDAELVEVPGSNHGVHLSHPAVFASIIQKMVGRVDEGDR